MFKFRAISFPLLLALLALIVYWRIGGPILYTLVVPIVFATVIYEICTMCKNLGIKSYPLTTAIVGGLLFFELVMVNTLILFEKNSFITKLEKFLPLPFLLVIILGWIWMFYNRFRENIVKKVLFSLSVLVIVGIPLFCVARQYFGSNLLTGPIPLNSGARQFLFLILVTKAMDTGGYIFGKLSGYLPGGNHKICPSVSPKKSWEGTIGGMLMSIGVSLIFWKIYAQDVASRLLAENLGISFSWYIVAGILLAIGSLAGDLTESGLKRACNIKDSGHIIPGMGGFFDVMDSFLYNGMIFWVLKVLCW